jgi:signal transduction histidine kinase/ActR/RegA family two-component response regulator
MDPLRLLIIDDDQTLCLQMKIFFDRKGYQVEMAYDGTQGLEKLKSFRPHLLFLDIGLPVISGIDVLKQVKNIDSAVRVIMITGYTEEDLIQQARTLGADDYVIKPFSLEYLSGEVMSKLQKQLIIELQTSSEKLTLERNKVDLLFHHVGQGVLLLDPNGSVVTANIVAKRYLGITDKVDVRKAFQLFHYSSYAPADPQTESKTDPLESWNSLTAHINKPFDLTRDEPKKLVLQCQMWPILNNYNERFGYLFLFRDVTDLRAAEDAQHRFLSSISHKLRKPLTNIRAFAELFPKEISSGLSQEQQKQLGELKEDASEMEEMINQLIAFSSLQPEQLTLRPVSVAKLLEEAVRKLPVAFQHVQAAIEGIPELASFEVRVDATLISYAFKNILENAFKFGANHIVLSGQAADRMVTIRFKDDGPGIPPEDLERVFDRFYQVDQRYFTGNIPGVGLGLTAVKEIVESHGGRVWVESVLSQGSTFIVTLPKGDH